MLKGLRMLLPSFSDTNMVLMMYPAKLHFWQEAVGFGHFSLHQIGLRCTTVEDLRHGRSASLASRRAVCTFLQLETQCFAANWYEAFHR